VTRAAPHHLAPRAPAGPRWRAAALLAAALVLLAPEAPAQDPVIEALRDQRQRVRTAEVLAELGGRAVLFGPASVPTELDERRRLAASMPTLPLPPLFLPPLATRPERAAEAPEEAGPVELAEIRWHRVPPDDARAYMLRFSEALWTAAGRFARTPVDTMATPEVRARLHTAFGPPTRTPVARGRPELQGGSAYVQFEYWFAVNDSIPFVVMDRDGPFGQGLTIVGDEQHAEVLPQIIEDFARLLMLHDRLMPYVDYYHSTERGAWFRTGYDGTRYYTIETERPRWARRGQERGRWYDFR
jgi:hypothetical protein